MTSAARRISTDAAKDPLELVTKPGDYCGPITGYAGPGVPAVFFIPPNQPAEGHGRLHHVASPPHVFRECADGSLEIRESIGCLRIDGVSGYSWHGYLDEGNTWREC